MSNSKHQWQEVASQRRSRDGYSDGFDSDDSIEEGRAVVYKPLTVRTPLISRQDAAMYLQVSLKTFDKLVKKDGLPQIKLGSRVFFLFDELQQYVLFKRHKSNPKLEIRKKI